MTCPVCPEKLSYNHIRVIHLACGPCQRQIKQMLAGFHGVLTEARPKRTIWDNTEGFEEWKAQLSETDLNRVLLNKKEDYVLQRCDLRDMKRVVGIPKFLPLERQVYTAWLLEGTKDERIQEVLGLTYSQLFQVKKIVRNRLQRQMAYYHQIKKLEKEGKSE